MTGPDAAAPPASTDSTDSTESTESTAPPAAPSNSAPSSSPDVPRASPLPRFSVLDIETSGLSTRRHRVLQIAVVSFEHGEIVDEWSSLIALRWPWQRVGPRRVHGIDRAALRGAPRTRAVLAELARRLDGTVVTAHNVGFDWPFIVRAARRSHVELPDRPRLCTLRLSRRLDPDRELSHRLADVCARYGIVNDRPHDALHDARATATVLPHLLAAHGVTTADELIQLYER